MGIDNTICFILQGKNSSDGVWLNQNIYRTYEEALELFSDSVKQYTGNSYRILKEQVMDLHDPMGNK